MSHDKIEDAAVIGIPDKRGGEKPMAFVVLKPGETLKNSEIKQIIKSRFQV